MCVRCASQKLHEKEPEKQMPRRKLINKQVFVSNFWRMGIQHGILYSIFADRSLSKRNRNAFCRLCCCSECRFGIVKRYIYIYIDVVLYTECCFRRRKRTPFHECSRAKIGGKQFGMLVVFTTQEVFVKYYFNCNQATHSFQQLIIVK